MRFDEDPFFEPAIEQTARFFTVDPSFVIKDYYVSLILKGISSSPLLVFKGGTSLSMCFHLINRFSEDIDVSYVDGPISRGQKRDSKELIAKAIDKVGVTLMNPGTQRSRRILNKYLCRFPSFLSQTGTDTIRIELAAQAPSFPTQTASICSLVGTWLLKGEKASLAKEYDLEPFQIRTQAPLRTFVDKVFALCDYYVLGKMTRYSRHIYDLKCLSNVVDLNQGFLDLFQRIRSIRERLEYCPSSKPGLKVSTLLKEIIQTHYYRDDYRRLTAPLLYDQTKYESCIEVVERIADYLSLNGL